MTLALQPDLWRHLAKFWDAIFRQETGLVELHSWRAWFLDVDLLVNAQRVGLFSLFAIVVLLFGPWLGTWTPERVIVPVGEVVVDKRSGGRNSVCRRM